MPWQVYASMAAFFLCGLMLGWAIGLRRGHRYALKFLSTYEGAAVYLATLGRLPGAAKALREFRESQQQEEIVQ